MTVCIWRLIWKVANIKKVPKTRRHSGSSFSVSQTVLPDTLKGGALFLSCIATMPEYRLATNANNKATELPLCRIGGSVQQNPHMRAFWASTISFFLAFLGWFALAPLALDVAKSMEICENQKCGRLPRAACHKLCVPPPPPPPPSPPTAFCPQTPPPPPPPSIHSSSLPPQLPFITY